jgi:hypothetical protein
VGPTDRAALPARGAPRRGRPVGVPDLLADRLSRRPVRGLGPRSSRGVLRLRAELGNFEGIIRLRLAEASARGLARRREP